MYVPVLKNEGNGSERIVPLSKVTEDVCLTINSEIFKTN